MIIAIIATVFFCVLAQPCQRFFVVLASLVISYRHYCCWLIDITIRSAFPARHDHGLAGPCASFRKHGIPI